jgi:hypothetical protein
VLLPLLLLPLLVRDDLTFLRPALVGEEGVTLGVEVDWKLEDCISAISDLDGGGQCELLEADFLRM